MKDNLHSLDMDVSKNATVRKGTGSIVYYNFSNVKTRNTNHLANQQIISKFGEIAKQGFCNLTDKNNIGKYSSELQNCFDLSCYILYGRDISNEVLQKQKAYGDEYLADFFKYILRMFFKSYDTNYILTKEQCCDIRSLFTALLKAEGYDLDSIEIVNFLSGKEIAEYLKSLLADRLI